MGYQPDIRETDGLGVETCSNCHRLTNIKNFIKVKNPLFTGGRSNICNNCIRDFLRDRGFEWDSIDQLCRYFNIPFVPKEFERLHEMNGENVFPIYAAIFLDEEYEGLDWKTYYDAYKELERDGEIERYLPRLDEKRKAEMLKKWGAYDDAAYDYLESLLKGMLATQQINGSLQMDQALKICKISYEIDTRLRAGADIDKMLASYDKLVRTAEFTPKNAKNVSDFDSVGELIRWLEARGWKNEFYNNVTSDIVDETIKNIQLCNQRLYTNEAGIGEEIGNRIEALKSVNELENNTKLYDTPDSYDLDNFEVEGYELLDEKFVVELEDGEEY